MFVEFKEKTFESYFVSELSRKSRYFYCPDQTDEFHLGFDSMFYLPLKYYSSYQQRLNIGTWLKGVTPQEVKDMGKQFNRTYPDIKANLFFQFKRPEFLKKKTAKEWKYWQSYYFRFSLYQHQHDTLTKLSRCCSDKAKVLYAAPRLATTAELINAAQSKKVIDNTQIIEVSNLAGHKKCTYSISSNVTRGHSEPKVVETYPFSGFLAQIAFQDEESFTKSIKRVGSEIKTALTDNDDAKQILYSARSIATNGWSDDMPQEFQDSWLDQLITVRAFSQAFGITICLLG